MKTMTRAVLTVCWLTATGCQTQTLVGRERPPTDGGPGADTPGNNREDASSPSPDVGNPPGNKEDAAGGSDGDGPDAGPPPIVDPPFSIPDALVGQWSGYFQAYRLRSGSDAITLNLTRAPSPSQPDRITVTLGGGLPPMVSGIDPPQPEPLKGKPTRFTPEYFEAFPYTAHQVKWNDSRLTFQIVISEPYEMWCQKQMSFSSDGNGTYNCIPSGSINYDGTKDECTSAGVVVSCARFWACLARVCSCGGSGCMAASTPNAIFDVAFEPFASGVTNLEMSQYFRLTRTQTDGGASSEAGQ
ncbi:MAG TPA: hypothetical protein VNO55_24445 [Polyangia bacterium]|nr:hypothetical protein [Polyangia bacterium]